jgi:hypothetical protein
MIATARTPMTTPAIAPPERLDDFMAVLDVEEVIEAVEVEVVLDVDLDMEEVTVAVDVEEVGAA